MPCLAIEAGIEETYEQALIESAKRLGWDVEIVQHIPFTNEFKKMPEGLAEREKAFWQQSH